jgi:hypothetical protein
LQGAATPLRLAEHPMSFAEPLARTPRSTFAEANSPLHCMPLT